jgi:uncharacterized SAM-binding protein YcdF (DUF218 family)
VVTDLLVLALAASWLLYLFGWRQSGIAIGSFVAAMFLIILLFPAQKWLAAPLEGIFPPQRPASVTGIVILGGSFDRILAGAALAHSYPDARLVIAGRPFARDGARVLAAMGVDQSRVIVEGESLNTWDDIRQAQELAAPKPGQTWLLVSSAVHIPRAMGVARHLGWTMLPAATQFISRSQGLSFDFAAKADDIDQAAHEYLGLLAYRLEGKTDTLLPRP